MARADRRATFRRQRRHLERLLELQAAEREEELARLARVDPGLAGDLAALLAADAVPDGLLDGTASPFLALLAERRQEGKD